MKSIELIKQDIAKYFVANIKYWNLVNDTVDHFREYIYTKEGNYTEIGAELCRFIDRLDKKAQEIRNNIDYSQLLNIE